MEENHFFCTVILDFLGPQLTRRWSEVSNKRQMYIWSLSFNLLNLTLINHAKGIDGQRSPCKVKWNVKDLWGQTKVKHKHKYKYSCHAILIYRYINVKYIWIPVYQNIDGKYQIKISNKNQSSSAIGYSLSVVTGLIYCYCLLPVLSSINGSYWYD